MCDLCSTQGIEIYNVQSIATRTYIQLAGIVRINRYRVPLSIEVIASRTVSSAIPSK